MGGTRTVPHCQLLVPPTVGSHPPDRMARMHITSHHMPNDSIQGMGDISAIHETRGRRPTWSLPPLTIPLWPKGGAGAKPLIAYSPALLTSPARHPHIIRHVIHHRASVSSAVPATSLPSRPPYLRYTTESWCHADVTRPKRAKNTPKSKFLSESH